MKFSVAALGATVCALALLAGCAGTPAGPIQPKVAGEENFDALKKAEDTYHAGDYAGARAQFDALAQRYPRNPYVWLRLGNACAKLQRYEDAAIAYQRALMEDKQYVQASYNLGLVRLAQSEQAFDYARSTAPEGSVASREVDEVFQYSRRLMLLLSNGPTEPQGNREAHAANSANPPGKESMQ